MKGNVLKLQNLKKNSEWCDKDQVLLYACFQLLVDFIEKEKPQNIVDYKNNKEQKKQWIELMALYRYWKRERPRLEKKINKLTTIWARSRKTKHISSPDGLTGQEIVLKEDKRTWNILFRTENQFEKQEDEMLQRLIKIRHHLWC